LSLEDNYLKTHYPLGKQQSYEDNSIFSLKFNHLDSLVIRVLALSAKDFRFKLQ